MKLAVPRPRSLAARLALILFAGLVLAYGLSFASQFYERYQTAKHMMLDSLEQDVAISVAMLDRLTPAEREAWLPRLERRTYRYRLDAGEPGQPLALADAPVAAHSIERALDGQYPLTLRTVADSRPHFQVLLRLRDGSPLTIDVTPAPVPLSGWLPLVLLVQLLLLLLCTGLAVRTAIGPLTRLVKAVDISIRIVRHSLSRKPAHAKWRMRRRPSMPCRRASPTTSRSACSCSRRFPTTCRRRSRG